MKTLLFTKKEKPTLKFTPKWKGPKHNFQRVAKAEALSQRKT